MIIVPPSDESSKHLEAQAASKDADIVADDPPPSYTPQTPPAGETSVAPPIPAIKPSNYVSISRNNGSVKGTWVVDPYLTIPPSLLPPLAVGETEATRKNFNLESRNGSIDASITLSRYDLSRVGVDKNERRRTTIYAKSSNGNVTTKLHAPHSPRSPFYLNVFSSNGSVHVQIPRSFHGLAVIKTTNGSSKFSSEVSTDLTTFSDIDKTRRCFIGDFSEWSDDKGWTGDEIVVESKNGSVKVQFDDEAPSDIIAKVPGFFGRLFGF